MIRLDSNCLGRPFAGPSAKLVQSLILELYIYILYYNIYIYILHKPRRSPSSVHQVIVFSRGPSNHPFQPTMAGHSGLSHACSPSPACARRTRQADRVRGTWTEHRLIAVAQRDVALVLSHVTWPLRLLSHPWKITDVLIENIYITILCYHHYNYSIQFIIFIHINVIYIYMSIIIIYMIIIYLCPSIISCLCLYIVIYETI